jgi:hypothetical protein
MDSNLHLKSTEFNKNSNKFNKDSNKFYEVLTNLKDNMLICDKIIKKYSEVLSVIYYYNTINIKNNSNKCIINYTNNTIKQLLVKFDKMNKIYDVSKKCVSNIEDILEYYMYDKFDDSKIYIYNDTDLLMFINKFRTNNNLKYLVTLKNDISNIKYFKINNKRMCLINGHELNKYLNSIYKNFKNISISKIYILNVINEININNEKIIKIRKECDNMLSLLDNYININKVTNNNTNYKSTTLINAIKNKHDICIKFLIESGVNINKRDEFEYNALMIACQIGHLKSVILLLDYGAYVNDSNKYGTPLIFASKNGHYDIVRYLIGRHANINDTDHNGNTALMYACVNNNVNIIKYLINNDAFINNYNNDGNNCLIFSCNMGNYEIVKYLIKKGGYINNINKLSIFNINYKNKNKINLDIVELLIENNINNNQSEEMIHIISNNMNKFNINQSLKFKEILSNYNDLKEKNINLKRKNGDIVSDDMLINNCKRIKS